MSGKRYLRGSLRGPRTPAMPFMVLDHKWIMEGSGLWLRMKRRDLRSLSDCGTKFHFLLFSELWFEKPKCATNLSKLSFGKLLDILRMSTHFVSTSSPSSGPLRGPGDERLSR